MGAKKGHDIEMKVDKRTLVRVSSEPVIFAANFAISQKTGKKTPPRGRPTQVSRLPSDDAVPDGSSKNRTNGNRSGVRTKMNGRSGTLSKRKGVKT